MLSSKADKKISILYVIDGLEYGGGERTFLQLIRHLPGGSFSIHVATNPDGTFAQKLFELGIQVSPFDLSDRFGLGMATQLRIIIQNQKIDIVHCQGARADFFARMAVRKERGRIKLVNTIAMPVEGFDVSPWLRWIYQIADRYSERFVDRFIVVSDQLRKTMIQAHHIPAKKVELIYNGIELKEYNPDQGEISSIGIRKEFTIDKDHFLVVAVGRLVWQKGFEYLIEAVRDIASDNIRVLIVGDGPLNRRLRELVSQYGLEDRIIFSGPRQDIPTILANADAIAIPSLLEGFPMVTLEAMAMQKPIIASGIPGIDEQIVDGDHGLLVPMANASALGKGIDFLLRNPDQAATFASNARRRVEEEFDIKKIAQKTINTYVHIQARTP